MKSLLSLLFEVDVKLWLAPLVDNVNTYNVDRHQFGSAICLVCYRHLSQQSYNKPLFQNEYPIYREYLPLPGT